MAAEAQLLVDIWDAVRDVVPAGRRPDLAEAVVRAFANYGCEPADLHDVEDDPDLTQACQVVFDEDTAADDAEAANRRSGPDDADDWT